MKSSVYIAVVSLAYIAPHVSLAQPDATAFSLSFIMKQIFDAEEKPFKSSILSQKKLAVENESAGGVTTSHCHPISQLVRGYFS